MPLTQSVVLPALLQPRQASGQGAAPPAPLSRPHPVCAGSFISAVGAAPSFPTSVCNGIPGSGMCGNQSTGGRHIPPSPGGLYKAGRAREPHLLDQSPEEPARPALLGSRPQHGEYSRSVCCRHPAQALIQDSSWAGATAGLGRPTGEPSTSSCRHSRTESGHSGSPASAPGLPPPVLPATFWMLGLMPGPVLGPNFWWQVS